MYLLQMNLNDFSDYNQFKTNHMIRQRSYNMADTSHDLGFSKINHLEVNRQTQNLHMQKKSNKTS